MYCPSCGTEVTTALNYCNRCGANLNPPVSLPEEKVRLVSLTGPTIAVAAMVVMSIGLIFSAARELLTRGLHPAALTWVVIFGLATIMGVSALFIRLWTSLLGVAKPKERPARRQKQAESEPEAAQLPPMRTPPAQSVTDHTTRNFEPAKFRKS